MVKIINQIFKLLSLKEKNQLILIFILIMLMALIDMLGIASIMPFIAILANPDLVQSNKFLSMLYQFSSNYFGVANSDEFIYFLGLGVFFLLISSIILRSFTIYCQIKFSFLREHSIGKRLFEGYLRQPYVWFMDRNSSEFGANILSEVNQVISGLILPMMSLITQIAVATLIISLLLIVDFKIALSISFTLIFSYSVIFFMIKSFLTQIGLKRATSNSERFKHLSEAFGATKEIKIGSLENIYISRFSASSKKYAINQSISKILSILPRYLLEGITFGGLLIVILILMERGISFANIATIIGLYAFAGYRLLPAVQQIYASLTSIQFSKNALDKLYNDLKNLNSINNFQISSKKKKFTKSLEIKNISFSYPGIKKKVIDKVSITVPAYSKIGIVGSTGSGKTSLIDIILGLLDPDDGTLLVDGDLLDLDTKRSWQKNIGYVPQQIYLSDSTIIENIALGYEKKNINFETVKKVSKIANIDYFINNELPNGYNTKIGERGIKLSGGQIQRIGIARALYTNPSLLLLDEATSALDNITEKFVMNEIENLENKVTIIIIAHRLTTVRNCDNIFLLDKGSIKAQGTFKELIKKEEIFKTTKGLEI